MLQRWSRICWKWSMFWKACNKHNTWELWTCTGCNQQRWATDSVRTRFQKLLCLSLRFWCRILAWNVCGRICSARGSCNQSGRNIMLWLGELCAALKCLLWRGLRCHCFMYNVSYILYLLQWMSLFFILHGWTHSVCKARLTSMWLKATSLFPNWVHYGKTSLYINVFPVHTYLW